ncbi:unnamed protein product [Protopolystoma xenopodis]|uniref:Uncharacterized protein n=1 Tax=Protopolystoma xenopodis TaxID=117903 RepID=A0A448WB12_9PLAT|nr:unnamed protein product [Protopolystoma xenopodis]
MRLDINIGCDDYDGGWTVSNNRDQVGGPTEPKGAVRDGQKADPTEGIISLSAVATSAAATIPPSSGTSGQTQRPPGPWARIDRSEWMPTNGRREARFRRDNLHTPTDLSLTRRGSLSSSRLCRGPTHKSMLTLALSQYPCLSVSLSFLSRRHTDAQSCLTNRAPKAEMR